MLRGIAIAVLLLSSRLGLATVPADIAERLKQCTGIEPVESLKSAERIGKSGGGEVYYLVGAKDRSLAFLFATPKNIFERPCVLFPMRPVASTISGRFLSGSGQVQVSALALTRCDDAVCPSALVVHGPKDRPLTASFIDNDCRTLLRLRSTRLFSTQESLEVFCQGGHGDDEYRLLIHGFDGALIKLHDTYLGTQVPASREEKREGACTLYPAGWMKIVKTGERPLLQVLDLSEENIVQNSSMTTYKLGTAQMYEWTFNPATRHFEKSSQPTAVHFNPYRGCRPRR